MRLRQIMPDIATKPMNWLPDPISFAPEDFLASTADLVSVLANLAGSRGRHCSRQHLDQQIAEAALSKLLRNTPPTVQAPPAAPVFDVAFSLPASQGAVAREGARASGGRVPVKKMDRLSRPERRRYCGCGQCEWCLSNARWDRIFNDKFADPSYYGHLVVRHNSTLAEA
jgi:hypothetical protein